MKSNKFIHFLWFQLFVVVNFVTAQFNFSHQLVIGFQESTPGPFQGNASIEFLPSGPRIDSIEYFIPTQGNGDALFSQGKPLVASNGFLLAESPYATGNFSDFPSLPDTMGYTNGYYSVLRPQSGYLFEADSTVVPPFQPDTRVQFWISQLTEYGPIEKLFTKEFCQGYVLTDNTGWNGLTEYSNVGVLIDQSRNVGRFGLVKSGFNNLVHFAVFYEHSRKKFFTIKLLTQADGLARFGIDSTQANMIDCQQNGASLFSPDGTKYAYWTECQIHIFDFDRCTGKLSNHRPVSFPKNVVPGGGLAFSMSGRYLYATEYAKLYRIDLSQGQLELDTLIAGIHSTASHPPPVSGLSLGYMYTAPDSNIYIVPPHRAKYMHVIHCPDATDAAQICFEKEGLSLPVYNMTTIPSNYSRNLPLLLGVNASCDSVLLSQETLAAYSHQMRVYPNPASHSIQIETDEVGFDQILLYNDLSQIIVNQEFSEKFKKHALDISHLIDGQYQVILLSRGSLIGHAKLLKTNQ